MALGSSPIWQVNRTLRSGAPNGAPLLHPVCQCCVAKGGWVWLFVPVGVLILLVLTNDLHQWFFAFQKDFVNSTSNYRFLKPIHSEKLLKATPLCLLCSVQI